MFVNEIANKGLPVMVKVTYWPAVMAVAALLLLKVFPPQPRDAAVPVVPTPLPRTKPVEATFVCTLVAA